MLKAQLATSQYAAEAEKLAQVMSDVQKVEAQVPQLRAEAERGAAALIDRQSGIESLERYEELLNMGPSRESREYLKARSALSPLLGADGVDPERIKAVLQQLEPEFRKLKSVANEFADSFLSAIDRAVTGGIKSFKDFVGSIAMDFARILQQRYLAPAFGGLVQKGLVLGLQALGLATGTGADAGVIGGNLPMSVGAIGGGGGFADGGPVLRSGFYMVGEEGRLGHTR